MQKTGFFSWKKGKLTRGCQLCVKGRKLVLFVTGFCPRDCFYCPLSDTKKNQDVVYANEWPTTNIKNIIREAELCSSQGAGITGGDPLLRLERTINCIKKLKNRFGKKFHIHLYAPLELVTEKKLKKLYKAGLDEIRVHPNLDNKKDWYKINLLKKFKWKAGVEIPAIPSYKKRIKELIDFAEGKIDFLNINELEISDSNANQLLEKGFRTKNDISYAIKGSDRLAKDLLVYCEHKRFGVHYCTAKLKDAVQLANRMKLRAKNSAENYDLVTEEGMLIRGVIYCKELTPSFNYHKKIKNIKNKNNIIRKLNKLKNKILKFKINKKLIGLDKQKLRLLTSTSIVELLKEDIKKQGFVPAIVTEYPTFDAMEIEVEFL